MKELAALLVLLFVIFIHPNFCAGLECKKGKTQHGPNKYTEEKIDKDSTCPADAKYCAAATCTKAGVNAFSRIWWACTAVYDKDGCAEVAKDAAVRRGLKATIFDCNCEYGAEGENFSNEKFEILPVPISNVLMCKKGDFDSDEYGGAYKAECSHDEDKYCYLASCAKGNEHCKVGETVNATVTCECRFGKANASLANENFTLPMVPTTNTDKPTNTTAEANLGVRAKISVCSGVLMAIAAVFIFAPLHNLNPLRERRPRGRPTKGPADGPQRRAITKTGDVPGKLHAQGATLLLIIAGALASKVEPPPGNRTTEMILRSTVSNSAVFDCL
ncbi:hypothetical protein GPALN_003175 [Globodera pallida]|nr:hypothetical protein GPALN_003175 [Globodera pallida]